MSTLEQHPNQCLRIFSHATRMLALVLAVALWMVPQMLNASGTRVLCDDHSLPVPIPAGEEEEVKHTKLPPLLLPGTGPSSRPSLSCPEPLNADQLPDAAHSEVPYPPPKAVA